MTGPSRFYDVDITNPKPHGRDAEIFLDGVLMKGVRRYSVDVDMDNATIVTVAFIANSVNRKDVPVRPWPAGGMSDEEYQRLVDIGRAYGWTPEDEQRLRERVSRIKKK